VFNLQILDKVAWLLLLEGLPYSSKVSKILLDWNFSLD